MALGIEPNLTPAQHSWLHVMTIKLTSPCQFFRLTMASLTDLGKHGISEASSVPSVPESAISQASKVQMNRARSLTGKQARQSVQVNLGLTT